MRHLDGRYGMVYRLGKVEPVQAPYKTERRKAIDAPPPGDGQIIRTALPDTFGGIRFEIGRMAKYVAEARRDAIVIDAARQAASRWARIVAQLSEEDGHPIDVHNNKTIALEGIDIWCRANFCYQNDPAGIEALQTPRRMIKSTRVAREVIEHFMEPFYQALERENPKFDRRKLPPQPMFAGDCVPFSQRVILRHRPTGRYEVRPIGDVEQTWPSYDAVSYNESTGQTEWKPVIRFVEKGTLPVYRVKLSNGVSFRCTENHELYVLHHPRDSAHALVKMTLRELMTARESAKVHETFSMPIARQIPQGSLEGDVKTNWVEGLYVAEGWREATRSGYRARIGMNNASVMGTLKESLETIGQPFGSHIRSDGLETVSLHSSAFSSRLGAEFGADSFSRCFPGDYLSLPRKNIEAALEAFALGDGYKPTKGYWAQAAHMIYNTASEVLARQIQFMHLVLGRPLSFYRQPAWKTKPVMYRLYEYKSYSSEKAPGLTSARFVDIELDEAERCCDITVADNHNFLLDGGALVHNCDEASTIVCAMAAAIDITPVAFAFGGDGGTLHHTWAKINADGEWYDSDITEPSFRLGDKSRFDHYEEYEVPL